MVIIDTDVLIKALQNSKGILKEVTQILEMQAGVVTPVQMAEVNAHALPEEIALINHFFDLFKFKSFDRKCTQLAGEFQQQYKPYYPELTTTDCLVGALAALNDYEIYTLHPQHFPMTEIKLYLKTPVLKAAATKPRLLTS